MLAYRAEGPGFESQRRWKFISRDTETAALKVYSVKIQDVKFLKCVTSREVHNLKHLKINSGGFALLRQNDDQGSYLPKQQIENRTLHIHGYTVFDA